MPPPASRPRSARDRIARRLDGKPWPLLEPQSVNREIPLFEINPDVDRLSAARRFAADGRVQGHYMPTGHVPGFVETLAHRGIGVPREIFLHQTA